MSKIYSIEEFKVAKTQTLLKLSCDNCNQTFYRSKKNEVARIRRSKSKKDFCPKHCSIGKPNSKFYTSCKNCSVELCVYFHNQKKSKSGFSFCSQSCAGKYNSAHKTKGTRRSKLEVWLQSQLSDLYPNLEIHYSRTDAINGELDIYIPSLKLAFECNGIFHYEPIYGPDKLVKIQNNDGRKFQACLERGIELVIMDTSKVTYCIPKNYKPFLDIITNLVNQKL